MQPATTQKLDQVPVSKSGILGLCGFLLGIHATLELPTWLETLGIASNFRLSTTDRVLITTLAAAIPMVLYDVFRLRVHERPSAGMDLHPSQYATNWGRVFTKVVGLIGTLGSIALLYGVFREYHGRFYYPFWNVLKAIWIPVALGAVPYIAWVDRRMPSPQDGYWQVGAILTGRWREVDRKVLANHARSWIVKGFFLPLMVVYLSKNLNSINGRVDRFNFTKFSGFYDFAWLGLYTVDVGFAVVGYALTFRALDAHIRSAEPSMFGWSVCLACYQPFWGTIERMYLHYEDGLTWGRWLADIPWLHHTWGIAIITCTFVYVWATVTFGIRFSNLTHRGVLTFGPYRWLRHPAYVSKNLSWWLISIPFIPANGDWLEAGRCFIALAMLNGMYALRAYTEEKHLSRDEAYRDYRSRTPLFVRRVASGVWRAVGGHRR